MTIPTIILYIVCFGLVLWQFFGLRQEERQVRDMETHMKDIERMHKRLHDQCVENSRAYLRLETRVSVLERKAR